MREFLRGFLLLVPTFQTHTNYSIYNTIVYLFYQAKFEVFLSICLNKGKGSDGGGFIPALALRASVLFAVVWSDSEIVASGFPLSRE